MGDLTSSLQELAQAEARRAPGQEWERALKLEVLITRLEWPELQELLTRYAEALAQRSYTEPDRTELIGLYSAGAVLAHIVNLHPGSVRERATPAPVWLFKLFPYVQVHPLHRHLEETPYPVRVLVCDEVIKTGYSVAALDHHCRDAGHVGIRLSISALFELTRYHLITIPEASVQSLFRVDPEPRVVAAAPPPSAPDADPEGDWLQARLVEAWELANEHHSEMDAALDTATDRIREKLNDSAGAGGALDLTYFLASTPWVMTLAGRIARRIAHTAGNETQIALFAPSPEGRFLQMMAALVLQASPSHVAPVLDEQRVVQVLRQRLRGEPSLPVVATDLCVGTGFTLADGVARLVNSPDAERYLRGVTENERDPAELFDAVWTVKAL